MRRQASATTFLLVAAFAAAACGGNPPPEPEPAPDTATAVDTAAERAAREAELARQREAEARELCEEAQAALAAGNYERARTLYSQVQEEYAGTTCADSADERLVRIEAIETIRQRIFFEFDRSAVTDEAAGVLRDKAEVLRRFPELEIVIEGHADERGSLEYNMALGQRRAEAARSYLVSLGLSEDMFRMVSYGEERPLQQGSSEQAYAANRRAEFVIVDIGALMPSGGGMGGMQGG